MLRAALMVLSDSAAMGKAKDLSMPAMREALRDAFVVVEERVLPDDRTCIASALREMCDRGDIDCIFTSGGTGFGPRDVTPEATRDVAEREAAGLTALLYHTSFSITPFAALSRAICAIRGRTLIVNLPGSPKAVSENIAIVLPVLGHAVEMLQQVERSVVHADADVARRKDV